LDEHHLVLALALVKLFLLRFFGIFGLFLCEPKFITLTGWARGAPTWSGVHVTVL
jgi:hypothetical protein